VFVNVAAVAPLSVSGAEPGPGGSGADWARRAGWFGLLVAFSSSVGQTFFIGLFGAELQRAVDTDPAGLGALYATATVCSGLLMFWLGALVDRVPVRAAAMAAIGLLAGGAALLSTAGSAAVLWVALFALRLGGQGLAGHLALVVAARHARDGRRGRAVALAAFGFIVGEALLPALVFGLLPVLGWRAIWGGAAVVLLVTVAPVLLVLARSAPLPALHAAATAGPAIGRWSLLQRPAFLAALAIVLVPGFTVTAVFFQLTTLAARLDWPDGAVAGAFPLFAGAQVLATWAAGRWVDRRSARSLARFYLLPSAAAAALLATLSGPWAPVLVFVGLGLTSGGQGVVAAALWVELFGSARLGLVRGVYTAMMVLATALSPWLLGLWLGTDDSLLPIAVVFAAYVLLVPPLAAAVWASPRSGRGALS
jgi:MFS family permease